MAYDWLVTNGVKPALLWPGIAAAFMLLEYLLSRLSHQDHESHDLGETAATLGVAVGRMFFKGLDAAILAVPFALAYQHRLLDFDPSSPLAIGLLFFLTEFCYYWFHRASHRVRWMWATHSVHHSPTRFNLTAGIRLGWTGAISGNFIFYLPIALIGFHPLAIAGMLGLNLLYQFFIHTEFSPSLGPLEWVLNTPRHHQVHHASNIGCLDRNYGGVLIVFDRLFGTFAEAPQTEALRYGLVGGERMLNPLGIAFREWIAMGRDLCRARSFRAVLHTLFAPPGSLKSSEQPKKIALSEVPAE